MVIDIKSESEQEAFIKVNSNIGMTLFGRARECTDATFQKIKATCANSVK